MIGKNGEGLSAPATRTNGNNAVEEEEEEEEEEVEKKKKKKSAETNSKMNSHENIC